VTNSQTLANALSAHAVSVPDQQLSILQQYCEQLWEWNTRFNLTRHTDYESFVTRDLHDSQQLAKHLQSNESVLDVGAGGGVPGIVLAVLNPALTVTLAESTQKKAAALEAIIGVLGLPITVFAERAEDVLSHRAFDTITARAVAPLKKLIPWFQPRQKNLGRMLLLKGPAWKTEYDEANEALLLRHVNIEVISEYATAGRTRKSVILEVKLA